MRRHLLRFICNVPWQNRLGKFLSDNAFAVYVFHPPILILAARAIHSVVLPSLLKFVILTCISAVLSFVLSAILFRRIPLLRRILQSAVEIYTHGSYRSAIASQSVGLVCMRPTP